MSSSEEPEYYLFAQHHPVDYDDLLNLEVENPEECDFPDIGWDWTSPPKPTPAPTPPKPTPAPPPPPPQPAPASAPPRQQKKQEEEPKKKKIELDLTGEFPSYRKNGNTTANNLHNALIEKYDLRVQKNLQYDSSEELDDEPGHNFDVLEQVYPDLGPVEPHLFGERFVEDSRGGARNCFGEVMDMNNPRNRIIMDIFGKREKKHVDERDEEDEVTATVDDLFEGHVDSPHGHGHGHGQGGVANPGLTMLEGENARAAANYLMQPPPNKKHKSGRGPQGS